MVQALEERERASFLKRLFGLKLVFLFCFFWQLERPLCAASKQGVLHIYNWANYIPVDVIRQFEKEMGVEVREDVFDTLEVLESKLLAARSGYDIVFPPAWPTVALFIPAGVFLPLDFNQIPNAKFLDPTFMTLLSEADHGNKHIVPYLWGTTGFAYNRGILENLASDAPTDSWSLLFDPHWMKKIAQGQVALLDSAMDVFPNALLFLKKDANDQSLEALEEAAEVIKKIRPWVRKFDSAQTLQDLLAGNLVVAQIYSTYGNMAAHQTRDKPKASQIVYVIPKEGALMWVDVMAIPKDAPNQKLAHAFINFILRPDIMARITNQIRAANAVPQSLPDIDPSVLKNPSIYPPAHVKKRLAMDKLPSQAYERKRLRLWTQVKTGY